MKPAFFLSLVLATALSVAPLGAQNLVPNPSFEGLGGVIVQGGGTVNVVSGGVPDQWRAFAVNGGSIDMEIVAVAEDELATGSPATNAVLLRLNAVGGDQGFDDDNGRFTITAGGKYHAEFYVKSANVDESDQGFNFGFPLFSTQGYMGQEPGGSTGLKATKDWQLVAAPTFTGPKGVVQGHISWRCAQDGGEDAILIALPSVTLDEQIVYPTFLTCRRQLNDVVLTWVNNAVYEELAVMRDDTELQTLATDATFFEDTGVPEGQHKYQILATFGGLADGPICEVSVFQVPIGTKVSVDLGENDVESGLTNTVRGEATDGENTFVICGPEAALREARSNWGSEDPTPDAPDGLFYFTVTDADMKAQEFFRIDVTVYDDPARAGVGFYLQYTNRDSTGPADIPNTFFPVTSPPPVRTLAGTGDWVVLSWEIADAGFRSYQQGVADFRIGVTDGGRLCVDKVELTYFPVPTGLQCRRRAEGVELSWVNNGDYEGLKVIRNGEQQDLLSGDATSYLDESPPDGDLTYRVLAVAEGIEAGPSCAITVFNVLAGTKVSVDLGDIDGEEGLVNSQRVDGGDGETEFVVCGPEVDLREARSNLGAEDPTPDVPDPFLYLNVTDPPMKSQASLRIEATVYDDPARAGVGLSLQYTNQNASGPGDIPNTFFPLDMSLVQLLGGTGEWVVLKWDVEDAGFRSFQQGSSDFRLGVTDGGRLCVDRVEVFFPSGEQGPGKPVFRRGDADAKGGVPNITDGIYVLNFLFLGGPEPPCMEAADADNKGGVNITDGIYILNYLFQGGPVPPAPGPDTCGEDPDEPGSPSDLGCVEYKSCVSP